MKRMMLTVLVAMHAATIAADDDVERLEASRQLTQRFAGELKNELQSAMKEGGPPAAIEVCRTAAPRIASRLARESGANVGRTSLKLRNPANLPSPWQVDVLRSFDAGDDNVEGEALEYFQPDPAAGVSARYMKAIPTGPMCLACHGEPAGEVREQLEAHYPHDRATGYEAGEIRGAFYVVWPEEAPDSE